MRSLGQILAMVLACTTIPIVTSASEYNLEQVSLLIGHQDAAKLRKIGIKTTLDLLVRGRTAQGRQRIAQRTKLPLTTIDSWVKLSDLMRISGIGPDVARLLTASGVKTVAELQHADAGATAAVVHEVNQRTHLSENPPGAESIAHWIAQAHEFPIVLE